MSERTFKNNPAALRMEISMAGFKLPIAVHIALIIHSLLLSPKAQYLKFLYNTWFTFFIFKVSFPLSNSLTKGKPTLAL
jgi:hypothetical protein